MNILYAYRYGIVGGVSTQLLLRQQALQGVGFSCDLFFSQDNGLGDILSAERRTSAVACGGGIFFGSDVRYFALLKRYQYDHIVVIDTPELLAASQPSWFVNASNIWLDVHTTTPTGLSYLSQVNKAHLTGVMVPTAYSAELVRQRLLSVNPMIIPNMIDGAVFKPSRNSTPTNSMLRDYVWVGKLDSHKNWRLALVYARLLQDTFTHIRFTLVGGYTASAETGKAFFKLADDLGVLDSVRWIDRIDNSDLVRLYRDCAASGGAMVITSRDESFGMAAAEALMCGCPVITNDLPVFREVFPASPLMQRVDIWQPEQFEQAALYLATEADAAESQRMYDHLVSAYGPAAFVAAFSGAILSVSLN